MHIHGTLIHFVSDMKLFLIWCRYYNLEHFRKFLHGSFAIANEPKTKMAIKLGM